MNEIIVAIISGCVTLVGVLIANGVAWLCYGGVI